MFVLNFFLMTRTANLNNIKLTRFGVLQIMDEIKNKFVGKWKLDRSERFEDFLRECGKLTWLDFALKYLHPPYHTSTYVDRYLILPVQCNIRRFEMKSTFMKNCKITRPCGVQWNQKKATRNAFNRLSNRKCIKFYTLVSWYKIVRWNVCVKKDHHNKAVLMMSFILQYQ